MQIKTTRYHLTHTAMSTIVAETWPLSTSDKQKLGDRVLGKGEKIAFIALPGKGGHNRPRP